MDDTQVNFVGFTSEGVLQALHDCAQLYNNNAFYYKFGSLNLDYARTLLNTRDHIEYLNGRFLNVSFKDFPLMDSAGYDKKNGDGKMLAALELLKTRAEHEGK